MRELNSNIWTASQLMKDKLEIWLDRELRFNVVEDTIIKFNEKKKLVNLVQNVMKAQTKIQETRDQLMGEKQKRKCRGDENDCPSSSAKYTKKSKKDNGFMMKKIGEEEIPVEKKEKKRRKKLCVFVNFKNIFHRKLKRSAWFIFSLKAFSNNAISSDAQLY